MRIDVILAAGGLLLVLALWVVSRGRLQRPDIKAWLETDEQVAVESPPLGALLSV